MKVYEMKPNEIGWAVEVPDRDAIIITLTKENRVLIVSKSNKMLMVSEVDMTSVAKKVAKKSGVSEVNMEKILKKKLPEKGTSSFEHRKPLKYLPVKEDAVLGKTLNTSIALTVYKHYGYRLWNKPSAEIVTRLLSSLEPNQNYTWLNSVIREVLANHGISYSKTKSNAYVMYLKGIGVLSTKREFGKKVRYIVNRKTISIA